MASQQPITSASARLGGRLRVAGSALTRASVWKVATSGRSSSCLSRCPATARQPVVGVQDVDRVARRGRGDPVGELVDHRRQLLLGEVDGPGVHVHHLEPGLDATRSGRSSCPAAHVHVARRRRPGRARRQLAHVDVHAAAVARARLGERRGVHREDGDRAHAGSYRTRRHGLIPGRGAASSRGRRRRSSRPADLRHAVGWSRPSRSGRRRRPVTVAARRGRSRFALVGTTRRCAPGSSSAPR
jgi:hypothetical protein